MKIDINTIYKDLDDYQYCDYIDHASRIEKEYRAIEEQRNKVKIKEFKDEILNTDPEFIKSSRISYYENEIETKRSELNKKILEVNKYKDLYKTNIIYGIYANFLNENDIAPLQKYIKKLKRSLSLWQLDKDYWDNSSITDEDIERAKEVPCEEFLEIKRRDHGRLWSKCFIHEEKTASLCIDTTKNFWYCFGCNAGGDVIDLIMKLNNIDFINAVKLLVNK